MTKPIIETDRLILREIDPEHDFEGWAEVCADAQTMRYIGGDVLSRPQAWRNMATVMGHWQIRGYGFFSLIEKSTGKWVGRAGPWNPGGWPQPEVGWTIHPAHTRKGYGAEAGRASIDYAFDVLGWDEVAHVIADGNVASMALAEKLGSKRQKEIDEIPGVFEGKAYSYGQGKP